MSEQVLQATVIAHHGFSGVVTHSRESQLPSSLNCPPVSGRRALSPFDLHGRTHATVLGFAKRLLVPGTRHEFVEYSSDPVGEVFGGRLVEFLQVPNANEWVPRFVPDVNDLQDLGKLLFQGPFQQNDKLFGPLREAVRIKIEIQTGWRFLAVCHAEPLIRVGPWDKDQTFVLIENV